MGAREQVPIVRTRLTAELGREPTLTELTTVIGVTKERVRQIYKEHGWSGRMGQKAKAAPGRAREVARRAGVEARKESAREFNARCVELAGTGMTLTKIAATVGAHFSRVQEALNAGGIRRCWHFTDDEDALVLDDSRTLAQIGKELNRSPSVVAQRRRALRRGAASRSDNDGEILDAFDRLGSWSDTARELGVSAEYVRRVVRGARGGWFIEECRLPAPGT